VNLDWRKALRDSPIDQTAKLIGLVLDTYANGSGECWPSRQTIAKGASCDVRTVDQALRRLEARGFLDVRRSKGRSVNRYYLLPQPNSEPRPPFAVATANRGRLDSESDSAATANVAALNGGARSPEAGSKPLVNQPTNQPGDGPSGDEPATTPRELPEEAQELLAQLRRGTLQGMP
jgi:Helix-turn-helix domain